MPRLESEVHTDVTVTDPETGEPFHVILPAEIGDGENQVPDRVARVLLAISGSSREYRIINEDQVTPFDREKGAIGHQGSGDYNAEVAAIERLQPPEPHNHSAADRQHQIAADRERPYPLTTGDRDLASLTPAEREARKAEINRQHTLVADDRDPADLDPAEREAEIAKIERQPSPPVDAGSSVRDTAAHTAASVASTEALDSSGTTRTDAGPNMTAESAAAARRSSKSGGGNKGR